MNKETIVQKLKSLKSIYENNEIYRGQYHDVVAWDMADYISNYDVLYDDIEYSTADEVMDDLQDEFVSWADSETPVYYADIAKWFGDNYTAVDEYIDEMGADKDHGSTDIMRTIQGAYCYTLEQDMRDALQSFLEDIFEQDELEERARMQAVEDLHKKQEEEAGKDGKELTKEELCGLISVK